jgi:hypothetical protein
MAYSYTDATQCLQLVIDLTDIIGTVKEQLIEQNLADCAGKDGSDVTTYRPYFVAARQIQRNRDDVTLKAADGATFDQMSVMIRSLFEEQIALDSSLGLTVPGAYDAELALERACGCGVPKKPINSVLNRRIMTLETV